MNTTLEGITAETAQLLAAQAAASGLTIDEYLRRLLGAIGTAPVAAQASLDEFMADMEALAEGTDHLPPTGLTYSREDIYFDHD